jgi:SH3 domain protein
LISSQLLSAPGETDINQRNRFRRVLLTLNVLEKISMRHPWFLIFLGMILVAAMPVNAEYINDVLKVTMRSGPELTHRVIKSLESGQKVEVVEPGKAWSRVRTEDGTEGWVLSRFLSPDKPFRLRLEQIEARHAQLLNKAGTLEKENQVLRTDNTRLSEDLDKYMKGLKETDTNYRRLKKESADFLALKANYEKTSARLKDEMQKNSRLEAEIQKRNITLLALGAGILFFGFVVGLLTRKNRRRSSLLS